jgi:hypothetical protein
MKKFIYSILMLCLYLQFTGCYSYSEISIDKFKSKPPDSDIKVSISDSTYYEIQKGHYYINNDTLFAVGNLFQGGNYFLTVRDTIPLDKIKKVSLDSFNMASSTTAVFTGGALVYIIGAAIIIGGFVAIL